MRYLLQLFKIYPLGKMLTRVIYFRTINFIFLIHKQIQVINSVVSVNWYYGQDVIKELQSIWKKWAAHANFSWFCAQRSVYID